MDTLRDLYRAICEQPDEDTPRLAFADLLDETPNIIDCKCAQYEGMRSSPPNIEETLKMEESEGALTLSGCWVPCRECDGSMRIDTNKVRAEYIRLSISLRNPPDETNMRSVAEWDERAKRSVALCKANYERWINWECAVCNGVGEITYERDTLDGWERTTRGCEACFGTRSLYLSAQERQGYGNGHRTEVSRRHVEFLRGFPHSVTCRREEVSKNWDKTLDPTLWLEEIVRRTPITHIFVTNITPYVNGIGIRNRKWSWNDWANRGRIPPWLFDRMWNEEIPGQERGSSTRTGDRRLTYDTEKAARMTLGDVLGKMIRDRVYRK